MINNELDVGVGYVDYPTDDFEVIVLYQLEKVEIKLVAAYSTDVGNSTSVDIGMRIYNVLQSQSLHNNRYSHDPGMFGILRT